MNRGDHLFLCLRRWGKQSLLWQGKILFLLLILFFQVSCDSKNFVSISTPVETPSLTEADVQKLIAQAVEYAEQLNEKISVGVTDREGNILGVFVMNGAMDNTNSPLLGTPAKARSASYLSSNQHGFTTVTACFITRKHFPPAIDNTAGGPLYGVPFSSLGGGDIQPNGGAIPGVMGDGQQGLTGAPGGVPIFKNGLLAGGLGIDGGSNTFALINEFLVSCNGDFIDEAIALAAVKEFSVSADKRGDNIFLDGIRLRYANQVMPELDFTPSFDISTRGNFVFPVIATPAASFPREGEVLLGNGFDFPIKGGSILTEGEVRTIIEQAVTQANKTRAAIRRPIGVAARVFISVVDVDGSVLGIWRTPDATLFSYDVSAQKARTALAFSDPSQPLGGQIRSKLGLTSSQPLSVSCRGLGFLSQDFYPPGIDAETLGKPIQPGPFFIPVDLPMEFEFQNRMNLEPFGNGITIFPGGLPLYKNGELVGAVGVSGDGVDQDDIIVSAGAAGFEPPDNIRLDQFSFDDVRLPYVKFPRQPEIGGGN